MDNIITWKGRFSDFLKIWQCQAEFDFKSFFCCCNCVVCLFCIVGFCVCECECVSVFNNAFVRSGKDLHSVRLVNFYLSMRAVKCMM